MATLFDYSFEAGRRYPRYGSGLTRFESDTFKIAIASSLPISPEPALLADITEIDYTNYVGDFTVAVNFTEEDGGNDILLYYIGFEDKTITASGGDLGPIKGFAVYNDTLADKPIMFFSRFSGDLVIGDGNSVTLIFPPKDGEPRLGNATIRHEAS